MKRKGFTLIELLAVIIVLAVIALITTPIILDVVENAKEKSRISSVNSLLDATRLYMSEAMLDDSIDLSGNLLDIINTRVKGTKPDEGEIRIDGNDIGIAVKIDGVCYTKSYTDNEIIKTNDEDCFISLEATCYGETDVVDDFEINYENCVAMLPNVLQSYNITLSQNELDLTCKNEMKVSGILDSPVYFKDAVMVTYLSGNSTYDILVSSNIIEVKTKKECQTCFEYQKNIDYDINYDVCMEMLGMEEACKGEKVDFGNGKLQTLKEYANSNSTQTGLLEYINNGLIENVRFGNEAVITNYLCYDKDEYLSNENETDLPIITDVVIPTTINGLKVTEIADLNFNTSSSFSYRGLTKVDFNNARYLTTIGYGAFRSNQISGELDLSNLKYLTVISGNNWGIGAFSGNQISSLKLPENLVSIGDFAFQNNSITTLNIPSNLAYIGTGAFSLNLLTTLDIPENLTHIGSYAFRGNLLTSLNISEKIIDIGTNAFSDNKLPDEEAFIYKRTDVNNDGIAEIDDSVLISYGGANITNVVFPSNIKEIPSFFNGDCGGPINFYGELDLSQTQITEVLNFSYNKMTGIKLPNSVTTIGYMAFYNNPNLTLIEIDNIKDAINGSPWGADNAEIKWLRDSE